MRNEFVGASVLKCQLCGCVLKRLGPREADMVAKDPYKFVTYCSECRIDVVKELEKRGML